MAENYKIATGTVSWDSKSAEEIAADLQAMAKMLPQQEQTIVVSRAVFDQVILGRKPQVKVLSVTNRHARRRAEKLGRKR